MKNPLVHFSEIKDERGSLIALENSKNIPFDIKRIYYIFGNNENLRRGFHAHNKLKELLVCMKGSCKVYLDDGTSKQDFVLDHPSIGLNLEGLIWREMYDFSEDCVLLVVASDFYHESDYIRDYSEFLRQVNQPKESFFKHENAIVASEDIGNNTRIWAFSHILPHAKIGENCNINDHTLIENDVILGNNVTIKSGVYVWDGVEMEDSVFVGPSVTFTNDLLPRSKQYPEKFTRTYLRKNCSIGANSTILAGVEIGEFAMIGAGSVVTNDVPPFGLVYGNPARLKGYVCECGKKLNRDFYCMKCNKSFKEKILLTVSKKV